MNYYEFLKLSSIIQKSFLLDIIKLRNDNGYTYISKEDYEHFVSLGIISINVKKDNTRARVAREQVNLSNINFKTIYKINNLGSKLIEFGLND